MNDWNVWNVSGRSGMTEMSLEQLELLGKHTDVFLEDLLAFCA